MNEIGEKNLDRSKGPIRRRLVYDVKDFPIRGAVCDLIEETNLELLHTLSEFQLFTRATDNSTAWHEKFYRRYREVDTLKMVYEKLVKEVIRPLYDEPIAMQRIPNFRVHLKGNLAVGEFHADSNYGHPVDNINYFVPLTSANGTSTFWVANEIGEKEYSPVNAEYGEIVEWYGAIYEHGNYPNQTSQTRVSLDVRAMPLSRYKAGGYEQKASASINSGMKFVLGNYYYLVG